MCTTIIRKELGKAEKVERRHDRLLQKAEKVEKVVKAEIEVRVQVKVEKAAKAAARGTALAPGPLQRHLAAQTVDH